MAFDPIQEDCLRLILAAMERDQVFPLANDAYIAQASDTFHKNPAALIHTDRDRSFHLISKATELLDYRIPFLPSEQEVERQMSLAEDYLSEAVELDAGNWDAQRMLATVRSESDDELVGYLEEKLPAVEASTIDLLERAQRDDASPYAREFASDLGQRPFLRWLAAFASRLFIAGQYRRALAVAEQSLEVAPHDPAGVRHTGMLALAKLEVPRRELTQYRSRHARAYQTGGAKMHGRAGAKATGHLPDAWSLIAQISLAYRAFDFAGATSALRTLMRVYPHAAQVLYFQAEFPDGAFCRVNVQPQSEDELVLAISEASPLLQEGMGTPDSASFSLWIAEHELVQQALTAQDLRLREQMGGLTTGGGN